MSGSPRGGTTGTEALAARAARIVELDFALEALSAIELLVSADAEPELTSIDGSIAGPEALAIAAAMLRKGFLKVFFEFSLPRSDDELADASSGETSDGTEARGFKAFMTAEREAILGAFFVVELPSSRDEPIVGSMGGVGGSEPLAPNAASVLVMEILKAFNFEPGLALSDDGPVAASVGETSEDAEHNFVQKEDTIFVAEIVGPAQDTLAKAVSPVYI
ncbi:hypothetical protein MD484_g5322, partial [Candolleomyces efflorescens]